MFSPLQQQIGRIQRIRVATSKAGITTLSHAQSRKTNIKAKLIASVCNPLTDLSFCNERFERTWLQKST